MSRLSLSLYHALPSSLRSLAASAQGLHLRWWRYGGQSEKLVEEALARETWSLTQWQSWQEQRLAYVLHHAATQVPYYRELWSQRRQQGDHRSWERLEHWPILEKEPLRQHPHAFLTDGCNPRRMFSVHTSGTTGKPLHLWRSRATSQAWYAMFEARWRRWYGVSRHDRWAILGGQLVAPVSRRRPPFWVWNAPMNQLYMSSYHLAPDLIPYYLDALRRYRIRYLWGYTSSLYALALEVLQSTKDPLPLGVAITNAEPLLAHQRAVISQAFQCPVRETYGMNEMVAAAGECAHGQLHLWPEVGWVETVENDQPVPPGQTGDLACTGLLNADMPLIRYRVGDRATLPATNRACPCGRTLPHLHSIEGRNDDVLYTRDGRRVGRLDTVFKTDLPVREAQIIQEAWDRVRIRYVPAAGCTAAAVDELAARLKERMGAVHVVLEETAAIPRDKNGKFRAVICHLTGPGEPLSVR